MVFIASGKPTKPSTQAINKLCQANKINQKLTKTACLQPNGKVERVISTLMEA
ncbi:hypothetical protein [Gilliamella sp. Fer4-1]|uniref:hypothetical protein n=1 Tax=Gilliamella sp. Fer4-1 TaxID=3120242 RepID=UPI00159EBE2E|nr:hypothetical protein [Gilliamella apicola]